MKLKLQLVLFGICAALFSLQAGAAPGAGQIHGKELISHSIRTEDGAALTLGEMPGNDDAQNIVVIFPGLVETYWTLEDTVDFFWQKEKKVFIAHSRKVARDSHLCSEGCKEGRNGLSETLTHDPQAIIGYLVQRAQTVSQRTGQSVKIHLLGHSQGGAQILIFLSNPSAALEAARPYLGSATPLAAPHNLRGLQLKLRALALAAWPLLSLIESSGLEHVDIHHHFFNRSKIWKNSEQWVRSRLAHFVENSLMKPISRIFLEDVIIGSRLTEPHNQRKLVRSVSRFIVPVLKDYAIAALREDWPVKINPEKMLNVPLHLVSATHDVLVHIDEQKNLMKKIQGLQNLLPLTKQVPVLHTILEGVYHVDPVSSQLVQAQLLPLINDFMDDAVTTVQHHGSLIEMTPCAGALRSP